MGTRTVASVMAEVAAAVGETVSFTSGMWSPTEVIRYISDVELDFTTRTKVLKQLSTIALVTGQSLYDQPADCIELERVSYMGIPLYYVSRAELDRVDRSWRTKEGIPRRYYIDSLPNGKMELDRIPSAAMANVPAVIWYGADYGVVRQWDGAYVVNFSQNYGIIRGYVGGRDFVFTLSGDGGGVIRGWEGATNQLMVVYVQAPTAKTLGTDIFSVPDAWVPFIKFGVLAKMWAKSGESQDPYRADYCARRYDFGVALARRVMDASERGSSLEQWLSKVLSGQKAA